MIELDDIPGLLEQAQGKRQGNRSSWYDDVMAKVYAEPEPQASAPQQQETSTQSEVSDLEDIWQGVKNVPGALSAVGRSINANANRWLGENIVQPVVKPLTALYDIATHPTDRYAGMTQSEVAKIGGDPSLARIGDVDMLTAAGMAQAAAAKSDVERLDSKLKQGGYGQMMQGGLVSATQNIGNNRRLR